MDLPRLHICTNRTARMRVAIDPEYRDLAAKGELAAWCIGGQRVHTPLEMPPCALDALDALDAANPSLTRPPRGPLDTRNAATPGMEALPARHDQRVVSTPCG